MPEKGKPRATVQRTTTQTSLKDHFRRAADTTKEQDVHGEHTKLKAVPASTTNLELPVPLRALVAEPPKPNRLFPIFTKDCPKPAPSSEVVDVDAIDIIDITSDSGLSETEPPLSSTHCPSPRSEMGDSVPSSSLSPRSGLEFHHQQGTSGGVTFPHVNAHEPTRLPTISRRKEPRNHSMWGQGDDAPFPNSDSQHVRGPQHFYTSGKALPKRNKDPSHPLKVDGSLGFLAKSFELSCPPTNRLERIHRSLTGEQCEDYFQTLSRNYTESHPAFTQIYAQTESIPSRHAELWTRRFRPRRANEVLGNECKAVYLRDWLSALQLRWQDSPPEEPPVKITQAKGGKQKNTGKSVEPRGVKRPRVIRAVERKRGNKKRRVDSDDDLDDFVVFTDEEPGDTDPLPENSEDEIIFCRGTYSHIQRREAALTQATSSSDIPRPDYKTTGLHDHYGADFSKYLTNTLLITGPPGCGKTAAVYACAEELEWEVFEVYPGVGRRSGASLDHLVGDVGRNHIVHAGQVHASTRVTKPTGLFGFSAKNRTGFSKIPAQGLRVVPISTGAESFADGLQTSPSNQQSAWSDPGDISMPAGAVEPLGVQPIVRQSLVLLEEVDILFKEDAGFWPAVVDFIRHCRRPVVMTCNDPGLVPVADLPLQTILVFEPCPSTVAAAFLQCLSLTEGCLVPHEDLVVLYETTHSMDGLDVPGAPLYPRTEPLSLPDLRRSITQLQMWCTGATHGSASEKHQGDEAGEHVRRSAGPISAESSVAPWQSRKERGWWQKIGSHAEVLSHVDDQLSRQPTEGSSMASWATPSTDDEIGYAVLSMGSHVPDTRDGLEIHQYDELIAEEAIRISRGLHEEFATGPNEVSINPAVGLGRGDGLRFRSRVEYQSQMAEALQAIVEPPAPLMPQSSVFLDYIPWVRYMVTVDDILERMAWDGMEKGRSGRSTRNSIRTRHIRTLELNERQHATVMGSRLIWEEW